ncbi:hypothetical protein Tco_0977118 [Tanacetum coccineum]|uniref:Reverse transcriptase domain-containing protein n=1 Tax=Tanacetum coccineum TaxID=301880 RepID=A0ABQ5EJ62_9ASTR
MSDSEDSTVTYTEVSSPFEDLSDIGSSRVDGMPMMPEDPYAYVMAAFQAPPSPDYFMPSEDEVFPAEEHPLHAAVSPTTNLPGYIADFDPEEDEEDPEEDPTNYPANEGDDDDNDDESSDDDEDNNDDVEEEEEEEEEHPAPTDSASPPVHHVTARITPPLGTPPLLPIPLPTPSPPMLLPSTVYRVGVFEVTLSPRKRLCIALGLRYEVGESSYAPTTRPTRGFRIFGMRWLRTCMGTPAATDMVGLSQRMIDFVMTVRQDTDEIYMKLGDEQDERLLMSGQLNMLRRNRRAHARESTADYSASTADGDCMVAGSRPHLIGTTYGDTDSDEDTADTEPPDQLATTTATTTTKTDAQLKALIYQGIANALAARDADRSQNGEDNHDSGTGVRRQAPPAREYTYPDFMKCKPLYFKGTERVIELTQWFEKMEIVFRISNCSVENQINDLDKPKKKMTDKYYPKGEIKKLKVEMWNLKVKGTDVDAIEFATELIDKKIRTFAERQSENKRKQDDNQQQQQNKRQNTSRAYVAGYGEKKPYGGSKPLCSKCNYHHDGQCAPKCHKWNRVGHLACDCRSTTNANTANNQRGLE